MKDLIEHPISVSDYLASLNELLAGQRAIIEGEVSDFQIRQEKWVTFNLKDEVDEAILPCFMVVFKLPFPLKDGDKVTISGYPRVYPKSGRLSFQVQTVTLTGEGALLKAFEAMQKKLEREGLFLDDYKKSLPRFPRSIGLVTSKEGDVLHDMIRNINHRWQAGVKVYLYPVFVQGQKAIASILEAIGHYNQRRPVDVIILARGGGSLEDLQAFNSEPVARAIFASKIPIVVGVGHEPDITIADLVADLRAATPTEAATLVVPEREAVENLLRELVYTISQAISRLLSRIDLRIKTDAARLVNGAERFRLQYDRVRFRFSSLTDKQIVYTTDKIGLVHTIFERALLALRFQLQNLRLRLSGLEKTLLALDPGHVLKRGYSLTFLSSGRVAKTSDDVPLGETIFSRLSKGELASKVVGKS